VKLVSLKTASDWVPSVDERIEMICLEAKHSGWFEKRKAYCDLLSKEGGREKVLSLSMCFSADMLNLICRKHAEIFSSIRGNLLMNYRLDYGFWGLLLAYFHLSLLRGFDYVSVMSLAMGKQVFPLYSKKPLLVGNFIDEKAIESYRINYVQSEKSKFIFVGSLTERKQPLLLVESMKSLLNEGYDIYLDIVGSGPLEKSIRDLVSLYELSSKVKLHGQVESPFFLLAQADVFVLPSLSEGVSRAALEALHLGLPCILRRIDGNDELVKPGINGQLFEDNDNLLPAMRKLISESNRERKSLLPNGFRQKYESNKILNYVETSKP
jgi:glycosyltransferase involved in cell wall biosynthesis